MKLLLDLVNHLSMCDMPINKLIPILEETNQVIDYDLCKNVTNKYPIGTFVNRLDLKPSKYLKFLKRLSKGIIYRYTIFIDWKSYFSLELEHIPISSLLSYGYIEGINEYKNIDFVGIVPDKGTEIFIVQTCGTFTIDEYTSNDDIIICFSTDDSNNSDSSDSSNNSDDSDDSNSSDGLNNSDRSDSSDNSDNKNDAISLLNKSILNKLNTIMESSSIGFSFVEKSTQNNIEIVFFSDEQYKKEFYYNFFEGLNHEMSNFIFSHININKLNKNNAMRINFMIKDLTDDFANSIDINFIIYYTNI